MAPAREAGFGLKFLTPLHCKVLTPNRRFATFLSLHLHHPRLARFNHPSTSEGRMKRLMLFALLGMVSFACAPPQEDVGAVRKQIESVNDKLERDLVAGVFDTTLVHYMDDAISMPDHSRILRGKKALRENGLEMQKMGLKFTKVEFTTTDVEVKGPVAIEVGTYSMTMEVPVVGEVLDQGKYLTIYEKAPDGSWKIKYETWNTDKMPEMPKSGG